METADEPLTLVDRNGTELAGRWRLSGEALIWTIGGKEFRIESDGDLSKAVQVFLRPLSVSIGRGSLLIKSCLACSQFQMSSMARDMGRGQRGVCRLHGCGVEICFLCDDFERAS